MGSMSVISLMTSKGFTWYLYASRIPVQKCKLTYAVSQLKNGIAGNPASKSSAYDGLPAFATPIVIEKFG